MLKSSNCDYPESVVLESSVKPSLIGFVLMKDSRTTDFG